VAVEKKEKKNWTVYAVTQVTVRVAEGGGDGGGYSRNENAYASSVRP